MIRIDPWTYFFTAFLVMILPLDWLLSALCAAVFHELCHIAVILALGGTIKNIHIGIGAAAIETEIPDKGRELLSALAGPAGSLLLLTLCHAFPKLSICACIQGLFNLLPVYPLDGGRALKCGLELVCPGKADKTLYLTEIIIYMLLTVFAVTGTMVLSLGIMPLIVTILLILKGILRKRPCKQSQIRVQ